MAAEASVYNYSDTTESYGLRLIVSRAGAVLSERVLQAEDVASDSTVGFVFESMAPQTRDALAFSIELVQSNGGSWNDAFADNDAATRTIDVVDEPTFRPVTSIPIGGTAMDFDGDGDMDVFQGGFALRLWRRDPSGLYTDVTPTDASLPPHPRTSLSDDFDGDGHPDLIVAYFDRAPIMLLGDGAGGFSRPPRASGLETVKSFWDVKAVDLERDGDLDLIFQSLGNEVVLANDGSGVFVDVSATAGLVDPAQTEDVAIGDVNKDGYSDVFLTNWGSPSHLFVNDGGGHFVECPGPWPQSYGRSALFLDYDGDGDTDIAFIHNERSWLYRNDGDLRFVDVSEDAGFMTAGFYGAVTDLTGDGLPEIVLAGAGKHALLTSRDGRFEDRTALLVDSSGRNKLTYTLPQLADLDSDGTVDIYHGGAVYLNRGARCGAEAMPLPTRLESLAFPNPGSGSSATTFQYRLPRRGQVRVTIWDLQGRRLRSVFRGEAGPGNVVVQWDQADDRGRPVPSGIYLHTIEIGELTRAGRIVLIR